MKTCLSFALASIALVACADLTETIVHIDATPEYVAQATELEVTIETEAGDIRLMSRVRIANRPSADFPFQLTIVPDSDDASRSFVLIGRLYRGEAVLIEQQAFYGFNNGESHHVDFVFGGDDG